LETGSRTGPELVSSSSSAGMESISVNPRLWKHQSSHPLDQILSDINKECKLDQKLRIIVFMLSFLPSSQKNVNEALANSDWVTAIQEELH